MFSLRAALLQDEIDELAGKEVSQAEIHAGDDHEPNDDPGGLHHLPTIGPLYPLQLATASLEEVYEAVAPPRDRGRGRRQFAPGTSASTAIELGARAILVVGVEIFASVEFVVSIGLVFGLGLIVALAARIELQRWRPELIVPGVEAIPRRGVARQLRASQRHLGLGDLHVGSRVLERIRRLFGALGPCGRQPRLRGGASGRTAATPFFGAFAIASHGLIPALAQRVSRCAV